LLIASPCSGFDPLDGAITEGAGGLPFFLNTSAYDPAGGAPAGTGTLGAWEGMGQGMIQL